LGGFKLDLAGGEILLYDGAISLIQYCASKGIVVNLTTNATLIDDTVAERIAHSGLYCVNLSLDGLEDSHGYIRNKHNAFLTVQEAAYSLLKHRRQPPPYISLTTVITKQNLKQLPEIIKLPQSWGINNCSFQVLDHNFGATYRTDWFENNEFWPNDFSEVERTIDGLVNAKRSGMRIDNSLEQLHAMKKYYKNPLEITSAVCLSGENNFIVNEFGEVLLCWNMPTVGSLLVDTPENIWDSKMAGRIRRQIKSCKRTCRMLNCNYV
jgi:MoaA/NifB/PqqE/SkfB family radical SAM enzyme